MAKNNFEADAEKAVDLYQAKSIPLIAEALATARREGADAYRDEHGPLCDSRKIAVSEWEKLKAEATDLHRQLQGAEAERSQIRAALKLACTAGKADAAERDAALARLKIAEEALEKISETPKSSILDADDLLEIVKDRAAEALTAIRADASPPKTELSRGMDKANSYGSGSSVGRAPEQGNASHDCETHRDRMPGNASEDGGSSPPQILPTRSERGGG